MRLTALVVLLSGLALRWSCAMALSVRSISDSDFETRSISGFEAEAESGVLLLDLDDIPDDEEVGVAEDDDDIGAEETTTTMPLAKVNFSPEQRKEAHEAKYIADFWVDLNMTKANELGLPMGAQIEADEDWIPAKFSRLHKGSLLSDWNEQNPDKNVIVGDQIVQVNDVVWHANSRTFFNHVIGQFKAGRQLRDGAKRILSLHILRERPSSAPVRSAYQRIDRHRKDYPKEFTVQLQPRHLTSSAEVDHMLGCEYPYCPNMLGFKWNYWPEHNWQEPWIEEIVDDGMIARWNEEHPDKMILEGDEVIKVNNKNFHKSRRHFEEDVEAQYQKSSKMGAPLELYIRRPHYIQEMYDMLPAREFVREGTKNIQATISVSPSQGGALPIPVLLGWQLANVTSDNDPVRINKIRLGGAVAAWNAANPGQLVLPNDQVVRVNNAKWHNDSMHFAQNLNKQVLASRGGNLELLVQRNFRQVVPLNSIVPGSRIRVPLQAKPTKEEPLPDNSPGWTLSSKDRLSPVYVESINKSGLVNQWNAQHPDQKIEVGDYLISVNGIPWRKDTEHFIELANHQPHASVKDGYRDGLSTLVFQKRAHASQEKPVDPLNLASKMASEPIFSSSEEIAPTGSTDDSDDDWVGSETE